MKSFLLIICIVLSVHISAQSVFGYWYGNANVKTKSSANNYLVELILLPEKNYVKGILNYYFKDNYRSLQITGNYSEDKRELRLYDIPVPYHGSLQNLEVSCIMNMISTLFVSRAGSELNGIFTGLPDYKYTCTDISFNLKKKTDISKVDSVMKALREFHETFQVWKPEKSDTGALVSIQQLSVTNYVIAKEYSLRENIAADSIEVESDSLKVDFYDNGEVDGDSISVFFNHKLTAFHQRLNSKAIHFDIKLDPTKETNQITMFAENLGDIPPNTALMIIQDGKKRIMVRLSSNLEKNATLYIRRKRTT
jgi:hypothetical protein